MTPAPLELLGKLALSLALVVWLLQRALRALVPSAAQRWYEVKP